MKRAIDQLLAQTNEEKLYYKEDVAGGKGNHCGHIWPCLHVIPLKQSVSLQMQIQSVEINVTNHLFISF